MIRLTCGQTRHDGRWSGACTNPAEWVDADNVTLHGLYCKQHKAGNARRKYGQRNLVPIEGEVAETLQALAGERKEFENKRRNEQKEQHHRQMLAAMSRDWQEVDEVVTILRSDQRREDWNNHVHDWNLHRVRTEDGELYHRDHQVSVEELKTGFEDVVLPFAIRWSGTSALTAKSARAVAKALIEAADMADEMNAKVRPEGL